MAIAIAIQPLLKTCMLILLTIATHVQAYRSLCEQILDPISEIMNLKLQEKCLILLPLKINTEKAIHNLVRTQTQISTLDHLMSA